jgi:hypothetical protein
LGTYNKPEYNRTTNKRRNNMKTYGEKKKYEYDCEIDSEFEPDILNESYDNNVKSSEKTSKKSKTRDNFKNQESLQTEK